MSIWLGFGKHTKKRISKIIIQTQDRYPLQPFFPSGYDRSKVIDDLPIAAALTRTLAEGLYYQENMARRKKIEKYGNPL